MRISDLVAAYRKYRKRARYRELLEWRDDLNGFERDLLIPELRGRLELMLEYFHLLLTDCEKQRGDLEWGKAVDQIVNPGSQRLGPKASAEMYFGALIPVLQNNFVKPITKALADLQNVSNFKSLGAVLNEVNLICESITGVKEKFLLFQMRGIKIITEVATGRTVLGPPEELHLIMLPFQWVADQLFMIGSSTAASLNSWRAGETQAKASFLTLENAKTTLRNSNRVLWVNIMTVALAIALAAFFMLAADPFQLSKRSRELEGQLREATVRQAEVRGQLGVAATRKAELERELRDAQARESALRAKLEAVRPGQ